MTYSHSAHTGSRAGTSVGLEPRPNVERRPRGRPVVPLFYIGCAGWTIPPPEQAKFQHAPSLLERYSTVFSAVEINSSFYRPHLPSTYAKWRDSVPDAFRFSVKMPRQITHESRLRDFRDCLIRFAGEVGNLQEKLGCILIQLPPSLVHDPEIAEHFFVCVRKIFDVKIALEPRHPTWFGDAATMQLQRWGITLVHADPTIVDQSKDVSTGDAYFRLHGSPIMYRSSYSEDFLTELSMRLSKPVRAGQQVWVIFDNTANGAAIDNALSLLKRNLDVQDARYG